MKLRVFITGASAGIGRELARRYLEKGATVANFDLREEPMEGVAYFNADVTNEAGLKAAADRAVTEVGRPDVWINNAGIAVLGPFDEVSSPDFDRVVRVNFGGVVNGTRVALTLMREPVAGTIVNIASVSGLAPAPYLSAYTASKHAVVGFTRALRLEKKHSHSPLKIVLVSPGFIKTAIMQGHEGFTFPNWLDWMIDDPRSAAAEIVRGIDRGHEEIMPTRNGRFISRLHRLAPSLSGRGTRLIAARNWRQMLGLDPIEK